MNKIQKIALLVIALIAIASGGLFILKKQSPQNDLPPIKIGAVLSLTGYAAGYGENAQRAAMLAAEEINQSGGIDGRKVEIVIEDDHTDAKDAVSAFQKLVQVNKVDGVIGSIWDFVTQPLLPLALQNNIPLITPTNFRIAGSFELNENSFAMLPDFEKALSPAKDYLIKENIKHLAVVRFNGPFGEKIATAMDGFMKERGFENTIDEKYSQFNGNDFRTLVLKLKAKNVDSIFLDMTDSDMNTFLERARDLRLSSKIITHVVALDLLANPDTDKSLLENIVFINWEDQPEEFSKRFKDRYGVLPVKSADRSYDAVYALTDAIAKKGANQSADDYLAKNNFETINGKFRFTDKHIVEQMPVRLQIIKDGRAVGY